MKSSAYPMISPEEAWHRIASALQSLPPAPHPLRRAHGLILAEDVLSTVDLPSFAGATMDGYAVVASDQTPARRIVAQQEAGTADAPRVGPGTAVRIMTGAPLPPGADAVVPFENADEDGATVRLRAPVRSGENVRQPGYDLARGDVLLGAGARLGPAELGLLASAGQVTVNAHPRPTVAILTTGEELVPPDSQPGPGQIRDSNGIALAAAVTEAGCRPILLPPAPDRAAPLRTALLDGLSRADVLLTSGGVSMGVRDMVKPLLEELGAVHFGRVAQKPGKPLTFALVGGKPVFALPGFPVSSLVCFENYVRPALRLLAGHRRLWRPEVPVRLTHDLRHDRERTEFARATIKRISGVLWATPTGSQGSSRLKSMVGADALLRLPPGDELAFAGDEVTAILISQPESEPA